MTASRPPCQEGVEATLTIEARRILERIELHYTPKHDSWLNMVEIEIGVLRRQCLDRRIDCALIG